MHGNSTIERGQLHLQVFCCVDAVRNHPRHADPPDDSDQDTRMQVYTRRLLLSRYRLHMLWLNAQRSLRPEHMDGAQGSNRRNKTHPMRHNPRHREMRTMPLELGDSSVQIYHPVFSSNNYESIVALEIALQNVFDHEKSQLPKDLQHRVIERWQFRGHGEHGEDSGGLRVHGFLTVTHEIRQTSVVSGNAARRSRRR